MRLTSYEIESIKTQASNHFGKNVRVYLFGSRTDEKKRGGDIDLFIQNPSPDKSNVKVKINFITDLILQLGEQKIDVVLDSSALQKTRFYKTILENAILL